MNQRQRTFWTAAIAAAVTVLAGCGSDGEGDGAGRAGAPAGNAIPVVATTPEIADLTRNIGGPDVAVTQIIKPNVDPHDYEPTPADIQAIATARIVVKNGVGLEEWFDRTIEAAGFTGTVVDASKGVTLREGGHAEEPGHEEPGHEEPGHGEPGHEEGGAAEGGAAKGGAAKGGAGEEHEGEEHDPHIWHDPRNVRIMVGTIEKALAAADPARAATFGKNLAAYAAEVDRLDRENAAAFARIPAAQRKLVTNHDAFGYYVQRYQLQFVGSVIPSLDTSAELSAQQLRDLVAKIRATGTRAIFTESSLPPKAAEAIAQQAGVKVVGGDDALFGDSLGAPGTPEGTYLGAERHNTRVIVSALGG
ncbi:metal ABC transporter substrate-binding protein [Jidongwangia harbinensis]|uniref:metal ABC transporter substrate-binding protein n=1 Tax=Jidongwangia harbinensis TaxID=2878561 RepID=UPI001CD9E19B|nr:metal ABC transporter substrate-binding protein [Jidongwangia harbinensis]MCA2215984.1 metal ABC transporter substrate-binding protein [Jidongwangia harbinensis]